MKLHMKVLGPTSVSSPQQKQRDDKPTYKEKFVPPEVSMLSYLMTKVNHQVTSTFDNTLDLQGDINMRKSKNILYRSMPSLEMYY